MPRVVALYRYPVKGFTPEVCEVLDVLAQGRIVGDRVLGIRFANSDVIDEAWSKKHAFIALVNTPGIARLHLRFNHQSLRLGISLDDTVLVDEALDDDGRKNIAAAIENYVLQLDENPLSSHPDRLPLCVVGDGITPRYQDNEVGLITLHSRESLAAVASAVGDADLSELRFRSNIAIEGLEAWEEQRWVGRKIRIGQVIFDTVTPKSRCLATQANPHSGVRDLPILKTLISAFNQEKPTSLLGWLRVAQDRFTSAIKPVFLHEMHVTHENGYIMTIKTKLRWGILGAARINERLLPAIVEASNADLVAIASRRPGATAQTLAQYAPHQQHVQTYDNLEALLDDAEVEAVYLPLANHEHAEWVLRAIERGKHVLCEKPMALTVADIEAIKAAASKHKVTVMEGFMYRFHPQHARVQELIRLGTIGEVRSVRASYSFMMRPARLYRLAESIERGGGAMWDIGCYAIHSARMFFDEEPVAVTAMAKYVESGADITTSGIIDFGSGKFAHFDFSFERARRCEYEIMGTKGGIVCHTVWQLPGDVPVISWWTEDGRHCEEHLPAENHFRLEIEHFSACVLNGDKPLLSLDDAKANCQIIVATLQSAAQGKVVKLSGRV